MPFWDEKKKLKNDELGVLDFWLRRRTFTFHCFRQFSFKSSQELFTQVMNSDGPSHMAKQKQDDQLEPTYSSYVRIRDVALKTCQRRWMIGRRDERGSGISVLAARHDDDDDIYIYIYIYIYILHVLPSFSRCYQQIFSQTILVLARAHCSWNSESGIN